MRKQYSEAQRRALFEEQKRTGQALGVVAKRLGIGKATAYQWAQQNKGTPSKATALSKVSFARVVRAMPVSWLLVEVEQLAVLAYPGTLTAAKHLRRVVRVLSGEDLA